MIIISRVFLPITLHPNVENHSIINFSLLFTRSPFSYLDWRPGCSYWRNFGGVVRPWGHKVTHMRGDREKRNVVPADVRALRWSISNWGRDWEAQRWPCLLPPPWGSLLCGLGALVGSCPGGRVWGCGWGVGWVGLWCLKEVSGCFYGGQVGGTSLHGGRGVLRPWVPAV